MKTTFTSAVPQEKVIYVINGYQNYYLDEKSNGFVDEKHHGTLDLFHANLNRIRKYAKNNGSTVLFTQNDLDGDQTFFDKDIPTLLTYNMYEDNPEVLSDIYKQGHREFLIPIEKGNIFSNKIIDQIISFVKPMQVFTGGVPFSYEVFNSANGFHLRGLSTFVITDLVLDYKTKKDKPAIESFRNAGVRFIKTNEII